MNDIIMKLLDRYLLRELIGPFFIAVLGFIIFMVSHILFLLTDTIVNKNIPFGVVARMMLLRMPAIMVLTLPVAMLFGTVLCISTMAANNEITALRSIGISFPRIMVPFLITGLLLSGLTFITNERVVPWATHKSEEIIRNMIFQQQTTMIHSNIYQKDKKNRTFYIQVIDEKNKILQNLIIYDQSSKDHQKIITARKATWEEGKWHLRNGVIYKFDKNGIMISGGNFNNITLEIDVNPQDALRKQKTPAEMTIKELKEQIRIISERGQNTKEYEVDLQIKYSLPLASFITALIGGPLSVTGPRSGKMMGIAYGFGVILVYYNLMSIGRSFARNGILTPFIGAWCPVIIVGTIGLLLLFNVEYAFDRKDIFLLIKRKKKELFEKRRN